MIELGVSGGLGNQMFQYAAGKALAERHGVGLVFDLGFFKVPSDRVFMLDRLRIPEADSPASPQVADRAGRVTYGAPFHYDPAFEKLTAQTTLTGYFQSPRYFGAIERHLRNWFTLRQPLGDAAARMSGRIEASRLSVSLHVRRGDYTQPEKIRYHGILGQPYYRNALDRLKGMIGPDAELFVFSDDPDAARLILEIAPEFRLVDVRGDPQRPWEDMALMARCHHHIIANSSLSWWGAWLNGSRDKVVIGPRNWFGPDVALDTSDLCPPDWIRL